MKKTLEYLYIFSKLSTSFILLSCIFVLGYFFYVSFNNQEKSSNEQLELFNKLEDNAQKIAEISKKISFTDTTLDEIKKEIQNSYKTNNSEEILLVNKKIEEIYLKLNGIYDNLEKIQPTELSKVINKNPEEVSSIVLEENKVELAKLVILKFENNLDYSEELNFLQNLNDKSKNHIFEKISLIKLKNFRGNDFVKNVFSKELDAYLKKNFNNNTNNFIINSLINFVEIKPSKKNVIKNSEINKLKEVANYIEEKKYKSFHESITYINNYEKYFSESLNQIKIAIEFEELIKEVS